jgi:hypothetical protein
VQTIEVEMNISKEQAAELARAHVTEQLVKQLTTDIELETPFDSLPTGGSVYWTLKGKPSDYWFILLPKPDGRKILQLGGYTSYLAISKETGEVSVLNVCGE